MKFYLLLFMTLSSFCAWANDPEADAETSKFLRDEFFFEGKQTTFDGIVELMKNGHFEMKNEFIAINAISYFKPFTPKQVSTLVDHIVTTNFKKLKNDDSISGEDAQEVLLFMISSEKLNPENIEKIETLIQKVDVRMDVRRAAALVLLDRKPSHLFATQVLYAASREIIEKADTVDTLAMLSLIDLLITDYASKASGEIIELAKRDEALLKLFLNRLTEFPKARNQTISDKLITDLLEMAKDKPKIKSLAALRLKESNLSLLIKLSKAGLLPSVSCADIFAAAEAQHQPNFGKTNMRN